MSNRPYDPGAVGRFIPGRVLDERYRVVELVGRGGMGEVYRAHDLKLGQAVALKFLPPDVARDPGRLESLFAEVRVARQVSHPNVCRVHDIEETEGLHFVSMEFVDGEDLATLLQRIGRLPSDKAVDIAREICAGLAAIHERGVLHRDLKPANVMIDGRGHVRITDFGLAELEGGAGDADGISGTPAYMAPESFSGGTAPSPRADLYSMGLVFYELFTGRRPFAAASLAELIRVRRETAPPSPHRHQPDLDPKIERLIMSCLERDPARRPASAAAVAAALPGGDPLSVLLAAGETPSPEQVAAGASRAEGLAPGLAWACLLTLAAGLVAVTAVSPHTRLVPALSITEPPQEMAARARVLAGDSAATALDREYGYDFDDTAIERMLATDRSASRWKSLATAAPGVVTFWYRASPDELVGTAPWFRVGWSDPPIAAPGTTAVKLAMNGALVERVDSASPGASSSPVRRVPADPSGRLITTVAHWLRPALYLTALLLGAWLARRNLRAGRGDTKRAVRVALSMAGLRAAAWILGAHLTPGSATEQFTTTVAWGLYDFAYGWVFYVAIEPYMRKLWPRMLISWVRIVDGGHRDARVGRDLLIGTLTGTAIALTVAAHQAAPVLLGAPPGRPDNVGFVAHQLASLLGPRHQAAEILALTRSSLFVLMSFSVILVMARMLLRNAGAAIAATFLIFVPLALPRGDLLALNFGFAAVTTLILLFVLLRFGLLAAGVGLLTNSLLQSAPLGMGLHSWPMGCTALVLAIVFGAGLYGFVRSLGGRPAIRDVLLETAGVPRGDVRPVSVTTPMP